MDFKVLNYAKSTSEQFSIKMWILVFSTIPMIYKKFDLSLFTFSLLKKKSVLQTGSLERDLTDRLDPAPWVGGTALLLLNHVFLLANAVVKTIAHKLATNGLFYFLLQKSITVFLKPLSSQSLRSRVPTAESVLFISLAPAKFNMKDVCGCNVIDSNFKATLNLTVFANYSCWIVYCCQSPVLLLLLSATISAACRLKTGLPALCVHKLFKYFPIIKDSETHVINLVFHVLLLQSMLKGKTLFWSHKRHRTSRYDRFSSQSLSQRLWLTWVSKMSFQH